LSGVPPATSRQAGANQQGRSAMEVPDLPRPEEPWRLYKGQAMIDTLIGFVIGVLLVAVPLFLYGFISAWVRDKQWPR